MATAETGIPAIAVVSAPYPPGPVNNNNNNNGADPTDPGFDSGFDCGDDSCCSEESCCSGGCHAVKELPFTGAPVATVATLGGGLLAAGTAASLIAVRRRRSTSGI